MRIKLLFVFIFCFSAFASSQEKLSVFTEDWFPFNYQDEDKKVTGSSTNYVEKLLKEAGLEYELELIEWSQAYAIVKNEPSTLLYSTFRTKPRETLFHWVCPINQPVYSSAYTLASRNDINATKIEELKSFSLAITSGTYPYDLFKSLGFKPGKHIQVTKNNSSNLAMLLKGRVDMIIESDIAIIDMLKKHGLTAQYVKKIISVEDPELPEICLAINKDTAPEVVNKIKQAHKKLLQQRPIPTKSSS